MEKMIVKETKYASELWERGKHTPEKKRKEKKTNRNNKEIWIALVQTIIHLISPSL